jgi:hypothetical protein
MVIALGYFMGAHCYACVDGTDIRGDMSKLETRVRVVVGTSGRVYDLISRRALRTDSIKLFVLDEADKMLCRDFKDQIHNIFKSLNAEIQAVRNIEGVSVCGLAAEQSENSDQSDRFWRSFPETWVLFLVCNISAKAAICLQASFLLCKTWRTTRTRQQW